MRNTGGYWRIPRRGCGIQAGQALRVWLPAALGLALVCAAFWSLCQRSPLVSFLPDDPPGRWIMFPTVPDLMVHRDGPRTTVFRRRFTVAQPARDVRLSVRALTEFAVSVNGVEVAGADPSSSWKTPCVRRLNGDLFRLGENELLATATCERGPPALWLTLDLDGEVVVSDEGWQASLLGSDSEPARLAASAAPLSGAAAPRGAERPWETLPKVWPLVLAFGALSAAVAVLVHWYRRGTNREIAVGPAGVGILCGAIAVAWCAIAISNGRSLRFVMGYDSPLHMEFIDYVARNHTLPLGNEGMEMGQTPLYYMLASMVTPLPVTSNDRESRVLILRVLSVALSVIQLGLLAGCLRQIYGERFSPQFVGLFVAGCLPVQLYLMHNTSNDLLAATLSTASLYLAMKFMESREPPLRGMVLLGICLGAAILAKLTALPVVLATLMVLFWQLAARRERIGAYITRWIVPIAACGLVCGWFFVRNYLNFGYPLPPDQAGFRYWQDPGYITAEQFVRLGRSLSDPFLASFAGVPDGIYSTFWGDGGWGGVTSRSGRPPWNYDLMAVGYLLAMVPTVLILTGAFAAAVQVVRCWAPEKLLVLAALVASLCGMLHFYLQHPMHGTIKAFYGLPSVAAVCIFAAEGYRVLTRDIFWRRLLAATGMGAWGLTALASFVVDPTSPETRDWIARQHAVEGNMEAALALAAAAVREHPDDARLRLTSGQLLQLAKRPQEARGELAEAARLDPHDAEAQVLLAEALGALGEQQERCSVLRNVLKLDPDNRLAYKELARLYLDRGDDAAAAETARAGLRVSPDDVRLHLVIAEASARLGDLGRAIEHYRIVLEWEPNRVPALTGLASLYATHPDQALRDGALAIALAERASRLTTGRDPRVEGILAAAHAEARRSAERVKTSTD